MATDTINGTSGTFNWDTASSWSLGRVPGSADDVSIVGNGSGYLTVNIMATDPSYIVASLSETTSSGVSEFLNVAGSLTVTGSTVISSGVLNLSGTGQVTLNSVTLSNSGQIDTTGIGSPNLNIGTVSAGNGIIGGTIGLLSGTATIQSITGSISINVNNATATVGSSSGSTIFGLSNGRLNLLSAATTLSDFVTLGNNTSTIDLKSIAFQGGETASVSLVSSSFYNTYQITLKAASGQTLYTFQKVSGTGANNTEVPTVSLASDGAGGTLVTLACYVGGTAIAVPGGERAVEELAIGDAVSTASGAVRRLRWVGRRSYAGRFLRANARALPIRFRAGSLGGGLPRRDLLVSPEHAMFMDGVLIPARHLVNGVSVVQDGAAERVDYFHLELDSHDVILAEGAASETFVDDNSRGIFQNAQEFAALYGEAAAVPAVYCAPRIEHGEILDAVRRRIDGLAGLELPARAGALRGFLDGVDGKLVHGWAQDPDRPESPVCLDVLVDGVTVIQTVADRFRPDLLAAGMGSGCHGFRVRLPRSCPASGAVSVRRTADGRPLDQAARGVDAAA